MTGGCRNAKASARGLTLASGFGARDGGLTILRTCNRPDVVVTMGVKAGCRGVWSLGSSVEEEEEGEEEDEEDDEDDVLLFGELLLL